MQLDPWCLKTGGITGPLRHNPKWLMGSVQTRAAFCVDLTLNLRHPHALFHLLIARFLLFCDISTDLVSNSSHESTSQSAPQHHFSHKETRETSLGHCHCLQVTTHIPLH